MSHEEVGKYIGALLIDDDLITSGQLAEALEKQEKEGGKTLEILIGLQYLDKDRLHSFLSKQPGVASLDLSHYTIDRDLVPLFTREFAQAQMVLPIDKLGKLLTIGMACPLDKATIGEVSSLTGLRVKAVLCQWDDMTKAIQGYYPDDEGDDEGGGVEVSLESFNLGSIAAPAAAPAPSAAGMEAKIRNLDALALDPRALQRLEKIMAEAGGALPKIAMAVRLDPALAANLIRWANSSAFGFHGKVGSVALASTLLGVDGIQQVIASLRGASSNGSPLDFGAHCRRSVFCARVADQVARAVNFDEASEAYTVGLLHEIGRKALAEVAPEQYGKIDRKLVGKPLVEAEQKAMGLGHPVAGNILALDWGLPPYIAQAIRFQHTPEKMEDNKTLGAILGLAVCLAGLFHTHGDGEPSFDSTALFCEPLKLDPSKAAAIYKAVAQQFRGK